MSPTTSTSPTTGLPGMINKNMFGKKMASMSTNKATKPKIPKPPKTPNTTMAPKGIAVGNPNAMGGIRT